MKKFFTTLFFLFLCWNIVSAGFQPRYSTSGKLLRMQDNSGSPLALNPVTNLLAYLTDPLAGTVDLSWQCIPSAGFMYYLVKRNGTQIATNPSATTYSDIMPAYGTFIYEVTAVYTTGNSMPATVSLEWASPGFVFAPDSLIHYVWTGCSVAVPFNIGNTGLGTLAFTFPDYVDYPADNPLAYCAATAMNCDEYIGRVQFAAIDKTSGCEHYADNASLSTDLQLNSPVNITVTNGGNFYSGDQVYAWIDYDHNNSFDPSELITLTSNGTGSSFTGTIIAPLTALPGPTTMRIRMSYATAASPCGTQTYGEVEDYQVILKVPSFITEVSPASGIVQPVVTTNLIAVFSAVGPVYSQPGIYYYNLECTTNDPLHPTVFIPAKMIVGCSGILEGTVTDQSTGLPIEGASVSAGSYSSITDGSGHYMFGVDPGTYNVTVAKTGYYTVTFVGVVVPGCTTNTQDAQLSPIAYAPACAVSTINPEDTQCEVVWCAPHEEMELIYDDGSAENYAAWQLAGNMNAVKFSLPGYPGVVSGGKIYSGDGSFPIGGSFIGQGFGIAVYAADGAGGMPGTMLDSIGVVAQNTGWIDFDGLNAIIASGDFYLVMIQGSNSPDCVPVGIDTDLPKAYRSYSRNVLAGGPWVLSPYQDMMMRAIVTAPGGDKKMLIPVAKKMIPQRIQGMISSANPEAIPGFEMPESEIRPFTIDAPSSIDHYKIWRITGFDPVIGVQWGTFTQVDSNVTVNTYTESGTVWANVPQGWVAYGIKAVYPSGDESEYTYTNPVPHKLFADITVNAKLICGMAPAAGATVTLTGTDYPFNVYTFLLPASGEVVFDNVIQGSYNLLVTLPGYADYVISQTISGNATIQVILEDLKYAPLNLQVDDMTLVSTWEPPLSILVDEDFEAAAFPPQGWQSTFQGNIGWFATNTGHFGYYQVPQHTYYAMTNDGDAGLNNNGCCDMLIMPALNLTNAPGYTLDFDCFNLGAYGLIATVELSTDSCQTWNTIYTAMPSSEWQKKSVDLSAYSGSGGLNQVWLAFHSNDAGQWSIGWCVDNVKVSSGSIPYQGYAVFLDGSLVGETQETSWTFNPTTINYGQTYVVGVAGNYCSGYSEQDTALLTSHFLYPPRNLQVVANENAAILTWSAPLSGDFKITGSQPRGHLSNSSIEYSPAVTQRTTGDQPAAMWDVLMIFNASSPGQAAVATDGNYLYTADWNGPNFHKYDLAGQWIEDFTIPGAGEIRDFAFDGGLFYGTNNTVNILKLDLVNKSLIGTIVTSLPNLRHISFDFTLDGGNGGFWVGGWTDENQVKMDGSLIQHITSFNLSSCSGSAFDDATPGGPYIWYFDQGGNGADIYQFDILSQQFTGFVQDAGTLPGFQAGSVAGGLEFQSYIYPGKQTLLGSVQQEPNLIFLYEMGDPSTPPCACINTYRIYRDNSPIADVGSGTLEYWDTGLDPATYCYSVTAVYNLTGFGFPGMEGESVKEGPECVEIAYGYELPFSEDWSSGQFELNQWVTGPNWVIDGQAGNPAPSAKFKWDPMLTNYSSSLESYWLNATKADSTVPYHIWFDFDLKLDDRTSSGNEKMAAEVWDGYGWVLAAEYANDSSFSWSSSHLDITGLAKDRVFKLRFRAEGNFSGDIISWSVDSIHVYYEYQLFPPLQLVSQRIGTPGNDVQLTWQPPVGAGVYLWYILDDNTAENGWAINPGYDSWLGNEFIVSDAGKLKSLEIFWQSNQGGFPQELTADIFDSSNNLIGTSEPFIPSSDDWVTVTLPDIPFSGTFYAMIHWNMLSQETNYLGSDEDGQNASFNYGWYYDGTTWAHLSDYGYNPSVFLIRTYAFLNGDKSAANPGSSIWEACQARNVPVSLTQSGFSSFAVNSTYGVSQLNGDSQSDVVSYNIYKRHYVDPVPGGYITMGEWELLANVSGTEYLDLNIPINNCYFYDATAVYTVGESGPSNIREECYFDNLKEPNVSGIRLFPNPASTFLNIENCLDIINLTVYNAQGSIIMQIIPGNDMRVTLDVSDYSPGLYNLKFTKGKDTSMVYRFIVIR